MFKYILKKTVYLIPPILLIESFVSSFFNYGVEAWIIIGNIGGYSLLTNAVFVYVFFFTRKYCLFTKLCVIGLIVLNVLCLLGSIIDYDTYSYIYTSATASLVALMWIFYTIRNNDFN